MDVTAAMKQFFNEKGEIALPPQLTLPALSETLFQADAAHGGADRKVLRSWDFSTSREGVARDWTRGEINTRIKAVAGRLQQVGKPGDRVAILAGNSPEYIFSFLGAQYAGMTPIPLYDPNEPGHVDHLNAVYADSLPAVVLTTTASAGAVRKFFADRPASERPRILAVDALPDSVASAWVNPLATPEGQQAAAAATTAPIEQTAFLQYTSGSTRTPAGVVLTNRAIVTNVLQIFAGVKIEAPIRVVSWLPMHHDMGIILAVFVTILGLPMEIMTPRDFIQQPSRWIDQLKRREGDEHLTGTYAVVPNFALELATRYAAPEANGAEESAQVDLSNVTGIIIGSEPVTVPAVENFYNAFKDFGLERSALRPSYGLAEASLIVATPQTTERPLFAHFDRDTLAAGSAIPVAEGPNTVAFASNGQGVPAQFLTIVDPETKAELPDGKVGEIWVHGGNLASGYLQREEETKSTFDNQLGQRLPDSRVAGAPEGVKWLATGDLAAIVDGQLYITGRLKDLIVIAGRNHYPQDIEATVQEASAHVRPDSVAAFSVEGDNTERLVILVERDDAADAAGDADAADIIRAAVSKSHGQTPDEIKFFAPGEINRTSSGKIARRVAKKAYLAERG